MRVRMALAALSVLVALSATSADVAAQGNRRTRLTITGFPLTLAGTTIAQFDAGFVLLGSTTYTIDLRTNTGGGGFSPRVTTVNVACLAPCPATGTLPVGQLQWQRTGTGTWTSLTTAPTLVESRTGVFNGTNDPWSNTMQWRYQLLWPSTPPGSVTYRIQYQLVVTAP